MGKIRDGSIVLGKPPLTGCVGDRPVERMAVGGWWSFAPNFVDGLSGGMFCHNCSDRVFDKCKVS